EGTDTIKFVTGDTTLDITKDENGNAILGVNKEQVGERSLVILADSAGNISEYDISEYFIEEEEEERQSPSTIVWMRNMIGTTDGISMGIVSFVFILLVIQVYVYWKTGMLGKNAGGLFTLGAWWLIIL